MSSDAPSVGSRQGRIASAGRVSWILGGAEVGGVLAQAAVMVMKAAHPIGRQGLVGIIGLSRLLNGGGGRAGERGLFLMNMGQGLGDLTLHVPFGGRRAGCGPGFLGAVTGGRQTPALEVKRGPAQAHPSREEQDGKDGQRHPGQVKHPPPAHAG